MVPAGQYVAKVIESEYKLSSQGRSQIRTRWEILDGQDSGFRNLWCHMTLTIDSPDAVAVFFRQLKALGVTQDFLDSLAELDNETAVAIIAGVLPGSVATIEVSAENRIERINPVPVEA